MQIRYRYLLMAIIIIVCIPIILSYILHLPKIYEIAGDEVTWVSFWGNYLGGIVSGIISFLILYLTFKKRDSEISEENKKFHNQKVKEDLASRVAHLNLMYLSTFLTSVDKNDSAEKLTELQNYHELINGDVETLDILYLDEFPQYISQYRAYVKRVNKVLGDLGSFYIDLQHQEDITQIEKIQSEILFYFENIKELKADQQKLIDKTREIVRQLD